MYMRRKQNPVKGLYLLLHRDSKIITNDAAKAGMLIKHLCSMLGKRNIMNCFRTHSHTTHIKAEQRSFLPISSKSIV